MNKISPSTGSPIDAVSSVPEEPVADSAEVPAESGVAEQRSQTAADGAREKSIDAAQAKAAAGQKQTLQDAVKGLPGFIDGPTPGRRGSTPDDAGQAIQRGAKTVSRDVEGPASTGAPDQPQVGEPVLVADNTRKAAPYPVSNDAIDTGLRRSDRFLKQLPEWTMNDKRAFLMRLEPGKGGLLDPIFELRIPSDGEIANHPLTRKFDEATRGATALLNQAKDFYGMAKDFLAAGDRTSAQQYFDQARALEHRATHFVYRNEQWLNLRREHVGQALDKHWEDLKEMTFADVSALGADAYVFGKAFGALTKFYKAGVRGAFTNLGLAKLAGKGETIVKTARLERLEQVLADPATLSRMKPQELVELSGGLKFGSSLSTDEAEALIKTAANRPEFQIARAEAIADDVISWMRPDGNKFETFMRPEDQNELRVLLTDDSKMVKMTPEALVAKGGGAISEEEAKTLISAADLRLNREIDNLSWDKAITALSARGDEQAAKELGDFMKGLEAHQRLVGVMGDKMSHAVIPNLRKSSLAELQSKYGLTEAEASALKKDLEGLPDKFSFYQHDLWGPAGKNKTSIARALGRNAPKGDPVVGYAHYRHNLQFGHHRFNDPLSRLEAALDKVDAMRDTTRAYREFQPMGWAEIDKELGSIKDPALRAWAKLSKQHIKAWEEAGELPRMVPTDTPRFKTGNRIDV